MRVKLSLAFGPALRGCVGLTGRADRLPQRAPVACDTFNRSAAARPLNPSSTNF